MKAVGNLLFVVSCIAVLSLATGAPAEDKCYPGLDCPEDIPNPPPKKPAPAGANSCVYAYDGECDEPVHCVQGTDTSDCKKAKRKPAPKPKSRANSCLYAFDGVCDEPDACDPGTDTVDCGGNAAASGFPPGKVLQDCTCQGMAIIGGWDPQPLCRSGTSVVLGCGYPCNIFGGQAYQVVCQ